jgi:hypothetical protein
MLTAVEPVLAEGCVPSTAAFPPGDWLASGITMTIEDVDEVSVVVGIESGGFSLTVDESGGASGDFQMGGEGGLEMLGSDEGYAAATWITSGQLSGTASLIQVDGETDLALDGVIDVSPNKDVDPFTGQDELDFTNNISRPYRRQFSPSAANCTQAFGTLDGPAEYGTTSPQSFFLAVRQGAGAREVDVQGQLAELLEIAQTVLQMDPADTDVLLDFVHEMLKFESLLASLESCDAGNELDMGGAWGMLQSVMFNAMNQFLSAAAHGAYSTRDVITAVSIWIQGGSLGWRDDVCLDVTPTDGAMDLFVKFEDVLLDRYATGDSADRSRIAAAAYQYGLQRVIAAVEGN